MKYRQGWPLQHRTILFANTMPCPSQLHAHREYIIICHNHNHPIYGSSKGPITATPTLRGALPRASTLTYKIRNLCSSIILHQLDANGKKIERKCRQRPLFCLAAGALYWLLYDLLRSSGSGFPAISRSARRRIWRSRSPPSRANRRRRRSSWSVAKGVTIRADTAL